MPHRIEDESNNNLRLLALALFRRAAVLGALVALFRRALHRIVAAPMMERSMPKRP
jgi:hypothetical protein